MLSTIKNKALKQPEYLVISIYILGNSKYAMARKVDSAKRESSC